MSITKIYNYLNNIKNSIDYKLDYINLNHPIYYIWGLKNARLKVIPKEFRKLRPESSQVDVFINGQYISPDIYVIEYNNEFLIIKFFKEDIEYQLDESDNVIISGDIEKYA